MSNNATVGQNSYKYISAAEFYREDLMREVVEQYAQEGINRFFNVFDGAMGSVTGQGLMLGQTEAAKTPDVWHVEKLRVYQDIVLDGAPGTNADVTAGGAGQSTGNVAIAAASHSSDTLSTPIRVNDIYYLFDVSAGTYVQVQCTAYTAPSSGNDGAAQFAPIDNTVTLTISQNDQLIYLTNNFGEGTDAHQPIRTEDTTIKAKLQIVKDNFESTLTGAATYTEVTWKNNAFGIPSGNYRVLVEEREAVARQFRNIDMALLLKEPHTNDVVDTTRSTTGLLPLILNNGGFTHGYGAVGSFAFDDFVTINKNLDAIKAPNEYKDIVGYYLMDDIEDVLHDYFNATNGSTGISYAAYNGSKSIAIAMNVKSLCRGGFTHHFKVWGEMSDPETLGINTNANNKNFRSSMFMIPMEKVMNYGSDETSYANIGQNPGGMVYPMQIRYLAGNGINRYINAIEYGTKGNQALGTRKDIMGYDYVSEVGLQVRNIKDFGWVHPSA